MIKHQCTSTAAGATGFVSGEVVKQLLNKGWNVRSCSRCFRFPFCSMKYAYFSRSGLQVRGTVRSLNNKEKVQHLKQLSEVSLHPT